MIYDILVREEYADKAGAMKTVHRKIGTAFDQRTAQGLQWRAVPEHSDHRAVHRQGRARSGQGARRNLRQAITAMTSSNDGPLLTGPVRAYKDHKAGAIIIETTKDNAAGFGLQVCMLDLYSVSEARVIVAIPELLRGLEPFAALGGAWPEADGDAPLITDACAKLDITVGICSGWLRHAPRCFRRRAVTGQAENEAGAEKEVQAGVTAHKGSVVRDFLSR